MSSTRDHSLAGVLSIVSYSLAAVTLTAGLILTVVIASTAGDIPNILSGVRGLGPFLSPLAEPISTGVELVAVTTFVMSVFASALWLGLGGMLAVIHALECRVRDLEASEERDPARHALHAHDYDV